MKYLLDMAKEWSLHLPGLLCALLLVAGVLIVPIAAALLLYNVDGSARYWPTTVLTHEPPEPKKPDSKATD